LIEGYGLENLREPYVKHFDGSLWEMPMKGRDGVARAIDRTPRDRRPCLHEEDAKDTAARDRNCSAESEGSAMTRRTIPAEQAFAQWRNEPAYEDAYAALDEEFDLAEALIKARSEAALTQDELAKRMGTTQAVIARLESGKSLPSTRTLQRIAAATGTRLRIAFAPGASVKRGAHAR
jgi:ribosome-binding protein aMBF1 (putative translation factor)